MLENLITRADTVEKMKLNGPELLHLEGKNLGVYDTEEFELLKGGQKFIYDTLDLKYNTSKEVFKKNKTIWSELMEYLMQVLVEDENLDKFDFTGNNVIYLINSDNKVVDIINFKDAEGVKEFKEQHKKYVLELTTAEKTKKFYGEQRDGLVKLICYDKKYDVVNEEYVPVVVLEMNDKKSSYKIFTGIFMYKTFTYVPSLGNGIEYKCLSAFIEGFNMDYWLDVAQKEAEEIREKYKQFEERNVEISVREITKILTASGYKLEYDSEDKLVPITNMSDETNSDTIQSFYNTFLEVSGETAAQVLNKTTLQQTFMYNDVTIIDILKIISKEYLSNSTNKVTAEILINIVNLLYNYSKSDKVQTETITESMKS